MKVRNSWANSNEWQESHVDKPQKASGKVKIYIWDWRGGYNQLMQGLLGHKRNFSFFFLREIENLWKVLSRMKSSICHGQKLLLAAM